jgi:putative CocE/NonD family hydrolase
MISSIQINRSVPIELRDGTMLRGDVYRPKDRQKHPAILMRTRYDRLGWVREFTSKIMPLIGMVLAGYVIVIQNVRGTYDSEGVQRLDDPFLTIEGPDGYDTIEWIASQAWCDGNVGMAGGSYLGPIQWVAAQENPPHLKAIAPWISGSGMLPSRLNGVLNLGLQIHHVLLDGLDLANRLEKQGKDVSYMRKLLMRGNAHPEEIYNYLPLKNVPHADFDTIREFWQNSALNPGTDDQTREARPAYEKVAVPCFQASGWYDFFTAGTFNSFNSMRGKGATQIARKGQHVMMGPWLHAGPSGNGEVGEINFGDSAGILGSGLIGYNLSFFNKYLRGMDIKLPAIRYFVMGLNEWKNTDAWPLPQTKWQRFFLHSKGHANTAAGDGMLSLKEPGTESVDVFNYNPHTPVYTTGCRGGGTIGLTSSPRDQASIESRDDVLCYSTPELKEEVEITGPLELHLFAATSVKDTDFTAKLVDVYPDGCAYTVTDGIIRARYRKSFFTSDFVIPGDINEYVINLETASQMFLKGHKIRIDISSSNFPEYDRNMNTGNPPGEDARGITATQTIYHDAEYASYIDLPMI